METVNNKKQKLSRVDRRPRGLTPLNDSVFDPNDLTSSDEIIFRREDIPSDVLNENQATSSNNIIQDGNKTFTLKRIVKDDKTEKDGLGEFCKSTVQGSIQAIAVKVVTGALLVALCGLGINLGTSTNSSSTQPTVDKSSQSSKSTETNGKNNTNNKKANNSFSSDSNKESNIPIKENDTTSNIQNEDNSNASDAQNSQTSNDTSIENNENANNNTNTSSNTTQNSQENNQDIKTDTSSQTNSNTPTDSSSQTNQNNSSSNTNDNTE